MQAALADVSDIASSINALVRQTLRSVAPVPADLELLMRVRAVVDRFVTQFGVRADLVDFGPARPVPQDESDLLVAVVREGLSNVAKHAPGASAVVTVAFQERFVSLVIQDDGPGPPADFSLVAPAAEQVGDHFGLSNLAWRLSAVDGTLSLDGNEDGGTTVRVRLPMETTTS
jgi:signal transduction histidine kinase